MKTELKCTGELEGRVFELDGARKCFKCGAVWGAVPRPDPKTHVWHMPQEPQSETPRTDSIQKYTQWVDRNGWMHTLEYVDIDDVKAIERELGEANKKIERYHDLVRYQRAELHQADLITDDEYTTLLSDSKSVARLEGYDKLQQELSKANERISTLEKECQQNNQAACLFDRDAALAELSQVRGELDVLKSKQDSGQ